MELNEFIRAGFNVGLYAGILILLFYLGKETIKIVRGYSRLIRARAEKEEYKSIGEKLKVRDDLVKSGINKSDIEAEIKKLSGIIETKLNGEVKSDWVVEE